MGWDPETSTLTPIGTLLLTRPRILILLILSKISISWRLNFKIYKSTETVPSQTTTLGQYGREMIGYANRILNTLKEMV